MQPSRILSHLSRFPFPHFRPAAARPERRSRTRELAEQALFGGLYELMRDALRAPGAHVFEQLLHALEVRVEVPDGQEERIPASGPLVVCANHPTGLLDGAIAAALVLRRRDDVKILVNRLLPAHEALDPYLIRVDPYGRRGSVEANRGALREALRWLQGGGALIVFPAGEVSRIRWKDRCVEDPEWSPSIARLIRLGRAAALPLHIRAGNSAAFHLLGAVHPRLKTARLPFELLNKRGTRIEVRLGTALAFTRLAKLDDRAMIAHLQARNILLGKCAHMNAPAAAAPAAAPAILSAAPGLMERALRRDCLMENGEWAVTVFLGGEDAALMEEIGRWRELSFRAAGEGTGRESDTDAFDTWYDQLVLWSLKDGSIAGGYRIGHTGRILAGRGVAGLYTSTLFRYHPNFFRRLGPAAELGRSFVCPQYQKLYMPLLALWQGIGAWICRHPECRHLFGPVSISDSYAPVSRLLLSTALLEVAGEGELRRLVRPRRPFRGPEAQVVRREWARLRLSQPEQLGELVASLEPDGKGMPVLLRQYLKLGGRLVAFNVDPAFSNVLDGLIVVDLLRTERTLLERYLTPKGARRFLEQQGSAAAGR